MIYLDTVLRKTEARLEDLGREIRSEQIKVLAGVLVEEINMEITRLEGKMMVPAFMLPTPRSPQCPVVK